MARQHQRRESIAEASNRKTTVPIRSVRCRRVSVRGGDGWPCKTCGQKRVHGPFRAEAFGRSALIRPTAMCCSCKSSPGQFHGDVRPWASLAVCHGHQSEAAPPLQLYTVYRRWLSITAFWSLSRLSLGIVSIASISRGAVELQS